MVIYELDFITQHNQFYISNDKRHTALKEPTWTEDTYSDRMGSSENMIVVYPESYGHITGELHLLDCVNNDVAFDIYDHIVEDGLNIESGILQILDCPISRINLEIKLIPGTYQVRVYLSNMQGYDSDEDESQDYCKIEIWPTTLVEHRVLKRYPRLF